MGSLGSKMLASDTLEQIITSELIPGVYRFHNRGPGNIQLRMWHTPNEPTVFTDTVLKQGDFFDSVCANADAAKEAGTPNDTSLLEWERLT